MSVSPLLKFTMSTIAGWIGGLKRRVGNPSATARVDSVARFHCVSIRPCGTACDAVLALADRRFLPFEVPPVPLHGCNRAQGAQRTCTYRHHADRRFHDRRTVFGCDVEPLFQSGVERRSRAGRRRTD